MLKILGTLAVCATLVVGLIALLGKGQWKGEVRAEPTAPQNLEDTLLVLSQAAVTRKAKQPPNFPEKRDGYTFTILPDVARVSGSAATASGQFLWHVTFKFKNDVPYVTEVETSE